MMMRSKQLPDWFYEIKSSMKLFYIGFLSSVTLIAIISYLILPATPKFVGFKGDLESVQMLLSVTALGVCFLAMVFNQWALKPKRVKNAPIGGQNKSHLMYVFIFTWALAECCALIGFYLTLVLNDPSEFFVFGTISVLTILSHPFTEGRVRRALSLT